MVFEKQQANNQIQEVNSLIQQAEARLSSINSQKQKAEAELARINQSFNYANNNPYYNTGWTNKTVRYW